MDLIYGIVSFITGTRYCVSSHCRAALPDSTACERCALCCKQHHRSPVFVPPCSDHQNFCIVSNCITPAQLTCRSRCCASHCNVAWCAAHGDPTLCHQCSCRSLTAGCRFCSCPLCCKKVAFARCSAAAHQGLCSSPLCEQSAANSICSLCDTCCKTAWCASHGNPSLCRRCIVADFMTECTAFLCAACGNRTDATRCKCPTHKRLCAPKPVARAMHRLAVTRSDVASAARRRGAPLTAIRRCVAVAASTRRSKSARIRFAITVARSAMTTRARFTSASAASAATGTRSAVTRTAVVRAALYCGAWFMATRNCVTGARLARA
jgi:hypothetical protein